MMKRFISLFIITAVICAMLPCAVSAGSINSTVFTGGALADGENWITENISVSNSDLVISTGNYFQPGYVYADKFLPVTNETRDKFALKLKIKGAAMGGWAPLYNVFLVADYQNKSTGSHSLMYVEPKSGWQQLENDEGKDYKELLIPFSDFKDKGRVCSYEDGEEWDGESNVVGSDDEGFRLSEVDWSRVYMGIGLVGVRYEVGAEKYGCYLNWGSITYDDVEFIDYAEPSCRVYGVNKVMERVENSDGTVPCNIDLCVEFNSDFVQDEEAVKAAIKLYDENDEEVAASVSYAGKRKYIITPSEVLAEGKTYKVKVSELCDIVGQTFSEQTLNIKTGVKIAVLEKPEGLSCKEVGKDRAKLSWTKSPEDIDGYYIYRDNELIAETTLAEYTDGDLKPSSGYSYVVCSYKGSVKSAPSDAVAVRTADYYAPENFGAEYIGPDSVKLRWDICDAEYYEVYSGGIVLGNASDNFYTAEGLSANTKYTFSVCAVSKNPAGNVYKSALSRVNITTAESSKGIYQTVLNRGLVSSGYMLGGWSTGNNQTTFGKSSFAGVDGKSNAYELYFDNFSGVNFMGGGIPFTSLKDKSGYFMFVKRANGTDTAKCGLTLKGNSQVGVLFDIDYEDWTPVYIPFSAYAAKGMSTDYSNMFIGGYADGGHRLLIDGMRILSITPQVEQCYITNGDIVESEPIRETSNKICIRFSAPMDKASLGGVKVYINGEAYENFESDYNRADFALTLSFKKKFDYGAEIKVVVPPTVKTESFYTTPETLTEDLDSLSASTLNDGVNMESEYEKTFTVRENLLPITAETVAAEGKAKGKATVSNLSGKTQNVLLICIVYNKSENGVIRYKGYKAKEISVPAGAQNAVYETDETVYSQGDTIDCFVWNDAENMQLLSD